MRRAVETRPFDLTRELFFFAWDFGFDFHVAELAGFEDFAALEALYVLRIFVSRDDLDSGMPTVVVHCVALRMVGSCG
jgi:hypothetical protein